MPRKRGLYRYRDQRTSHFFVILELDINKIEQEGDIGAPIGISRQTNHDLMSPHITRDRREYPPIEPIVCED
ncbi:jg16041 [Pararge aegeria aegeria]|uniref:Jg16041 protein n=1 Tax=Pararge aegeria aegeria TaxID=348720 RepID=A0A8S4SPH7_9NEOP|nr:jg16041 [Pararge aegeria aegeria]